jgi:AGZA family xanthine/uracil permease-like MFS transporter
LVVAILHQRRIKGAIVLSVLALTVVGLAVPSHDGGKLTQLPQRLVAAPASLAPTFLALDFRYLAMHPAQTLPLILAFLFVDLFDNMGTLIGVCSRLGLLDDKGRLPGIGGRLKRMPLRPWSELR